MARLRVRYLPLRAFGRPSHAGARGEQGTGPRWPLGLLGLAANVAWSPSGRILAVSVASAAMAVASAAMAVASAAMAVALAAVAVAALEAATAQHVPRGVWVPLVASAGPRGLAAVARLPVPLASRAGAAAHVRSPAHFGVGAAAAHVRSPAHFGVGAAAAHVHSPACARRSGAQARLRP